MKLIYEITTMDDKIQKHECIDFAGWGGDFITLYKKDFKREYIRISTVLKVTSEFKI